MEPNRLLEMFWAGLPALITAAVVVGLLLLTRWTLSRREAHKPEKRVQHQLLLFTLGLVGLVVIILLLPIGDARRGQLLSLLGLLVSAAIALSSTTLLGNAMAGFMQRSIRSFRSGDFVEVGDHFGRVSERGLFHVEIQTERRELTTLPNTYLISHPVTVVRSSGTIVSADVSLGYDVPRGQVRELLLAAAEEAQLEEPYVRVIELGDYSVQYRVGGMLNEVKRLLSARSRLRERMLDQLHTNGVEIVSPAYMNTRALEVQEPVLPPEEEPAPKPLVERRTSADLAFDKAEQAESMERMQLRYDALNAEVDDVKKQAAEAATDADRERLATDLERLESRRESLARALEAMREQAPD